MMLYIPIFGLDGRSISSWSANSTINNLFYEIRNWYRENIFEDFNPQDFIDELQFDKEEDFNLFKLLFEDKCYIARRRQINV